MKMTLIAIYAVATIMINSMLLEGILIRDGCGTGWDLADINTGTKFQYCYRFVYEKSTNFNWFQASRNCKQNGGELFAPENDLEGS